MSYSTARRGQFGQGFSTFLFNVSKKKKKRNNIYIFFFSKRKTKYESIYESRLRMSLFYFGVSEEEK